MAKNSEVLKQSIDQLLQEIRIVLPGTQALIGFQFIAFFNPVFLDLPLSYKYLHFATLLLSILCSLCLIAPVAFQQVGENGKPTERFLRFTRKMINIAMLLLLLSITGNIFVTAKIIAINTTAAVAISGTVFLAGLLLWYGYALYRRNIRN